MTPPAKPDLAATLARLRDRFLATSGQVVEVFEGLALRLRADAADGAAIEELRQAAHRSHGTAGSYGFHAASRLAASLETLAMDWLGDPSLDRDRRSTIVANFATLLRGTFTDAAGHAHRRVLLVDLPDDVARTLIAAALHDAIAPERVAAASLPQAVGVDRSVGIIAEVASELPPLVAPAPRVVRLAGGADPLSALSACFGSSP